MLKKICSAILLTVCADNFKSFLNFRGKYHTETRSVEPIEPQTAPKIPKYSVPIMTRGMNKRACKPVTKLVPFTSPNERHN